MDSSIVRKFRVCFGVDVSDISILGVFEFVFSSKDVLGIIVWGDFGGCGDFVWLGEVKEMSVFEVFENFVVFWWGYYGVVCVDWVVFEVVGESLEEEFVKDVIVVDV